MKIRDTAPTDTDAILAIYAGAKAALKEAGVDQWQNGYPNGGSLSADIAGRISRVCAEGEEILATAAAYVGHEPAYDQIFEGNWLIQANLYGIVHRIAVAPRAKRKGAAQNLFAYTEALAKTAGVKSLRCDTHRENRVMQLTLEKAGFTYCGVIYLEDGDERLAYEKLL